MKTIFSKNIVLLLIVVLFISLGINMHNAILPIYLPSIGGTSSTIGLLTGLFTLSGFIFRSLFGHWADHKGRRFVLMIGVIVFTAVAFFYGFASSVISLLVLRFLHGIGNSAQNTAVGTMISDSVESIYLTKAFGYSLIASTLATAIGPVLAIYLFNQYGYQISFNVTFSLVFVALIASLFIKETKHTIDTISYSKEAFFEKSALWPSIFIFLSGVGLASVFSFMIPYAIEIGIENIGTFFTVFSITNLIGIKAADTISQRIGSNKSIFIGLFMIMSSYFILFIAKDIILIWLSAVLVGYGFGSIMPSLQASAIANSPSHRKGAANATYYSAMDISYGGGAIIIGLIAKTLDLPSIFLGCGLLMVASLILYRFTLYKSIE